MHVLKWIAALLFGASLVACACPQPLDYCEAAKGKDTWNKVEACYEVNLNAIKKYNESLQD